MKELIKGEKWQSGSDELEVGRNLFQMNSSSHLLGDSKALKEQLATDGYLYLPQFHDKEKIRHAQNEIAGILHERKALALDCKEGEFRIAPEKKGGVSFKFEDVMKCPTYLDVVNSEKVMSLFGQLLDDEIFTFPYKWMRAVGEGASTGIHYDIVYMGRGTKDLLTCWSALDDIPVEKGGLLMGANQSGKENLDKTYGEVDVDRDEVDIGWYTKSPNEVIENFGGHWLTSNYSMGDIVIFGMYQFHGSLVNTTHELRLSCDTRYQRESEKKDDRWIGKNPKAHQSKATRKLADLKQSWAI